MPQSTEETVQAEVLDAIRSIAQRDLGFDEIGGNVHAHLLEFEAYELWGQYLSAKVGGVPVAQAVGVQVLSSEEIGAQHYLVRRSYEVTISEYVLLGVNGSGVRTLVTHARKIRGAIRERGSNLSRLADGTEEIGDLILDIVDNVEVEGGRILRGTLVYRFVKTNPDY